MENTNNVGVGSRVTNERKKRIRKGAKSNFFILLAIFIFYLVIAWLLILSGDDWAWGGDIGQARLDNHFDAYNGRYFGNIIEMIITRNLFARLLIYSIVNTGTVFLIREILNRKVAYVYCFLLILLLPVSFYSQTYGWLAGFANYNTSTFLFLLIIYLVQKNRDSIFLCVSILVLALLTQLFIENVAIASILIAGIGLLAAFIFKERVLSYLSWLAGSTIGASIMFSNSAYHIENNMRGFSNADLNTFSSMLLTDWTELYVKQNALLLLFFSIVMYLLAEKKTLGKLLLYFFPSSYFMLRYLLEITWRQQSMPVLIIELFLIFIFLTSLLFAISKASIPLSSKRRAFSYITISLLLVAPFLIVTPYGPRNILTSYVFLGLALFELILHTKINLADRRNQKVALTFVFCISLFFIGMHGVNRYEESQRILHLKQELNTNQTEVNLKRLPYEFIGHDLTPPDGSVQSDRQKVHYNISLNTKFNIENYSDPSLDELLENK
ncbi:hypothetical protein C7K38_10575 [Tetragenococcus osmophilus]|uniref:Glucosyltransferase n=1 Tax=Tetragenococcus osmophilus TaxID=526944 RepID=A0AA37XJT6_9ENTE|nr:hypothetical protein [Tetragenococcus osmophilus]AYW48785.1 hypothetical protein C7K38_10575 [Tetragenococcus osmophilus]GMA54772.1 hypothetical protein GCM10025857_61290 [Alicyclobacillus contaminans]GMA71419.1 hypothetical protein GCM10025885_04680 [Tetragenococcus osmophilus]